MAGDGTMAKYQDTVEVINDNDGTQSSQVHMPEGTWKKFMTVRYRRKK